MIVMINHYYHDNDCDPALKAIGVQPLDDRFKAASLINLKMLHYTDRIKLTILYLTDICLVDLTMVQIFVFK